MNHATQNNGTTTPKRKIPSEALCHALTLVARGSSANAASKLAGVPRSTLQMWVKKMEQPEKPPRRRVNQGRGVGCEENYPASDYSDEELSFLHAIDRYKRTACRPCPTWREVLRIVHALGYHKPLS